MRPQTTPEMIERARQLVIEKPSTSYVQRHLGIGYNQACEIMEHFEDEGLITACDAAGMRTVIVDTRWHGC